VRPHTDHTDGTGTIRPHLRTARLRASRKGPS
jgi:hypothetical protein